MGCAGQAVGVCGLQMQDVVVQLQAGTSTCPAG